MNLLTKRKETHRLREQNYGCRWGGTIREFGMDVCTLLYLKWNKQQGSAVEYMELCSVVCGSLDRRGVWGRKDTCICTESLCYSPESITALLIGYNPIQNQKLKKYKVTHLVTRDIFKICCIIIILRYFLGRKRTMVLHTALIAVHTLYFIAKE